MPIQSLVTVPLPVPVLITVRRFRCNRPCCTTTTGTPARVTVALRAWAPMLIASDKVSVADPAPAGDSAIVIQSALLSARQPQRLSDASESDWVVAAEATVSVVGDTTYEQAMAGGATSVLNTPPPSVPAYTTLWPDGLTLSEVTTWLKRPSFRGCQLRAPSV